jgi:hypothetical protein
MKVIKTTLNMVDAGLTPEMQKTGVYMLKMRLRRTPMMNSERMDKAWANFRGLHHEEAV